MSRRGWLLFTRHVHQWFLLSAAEQRLSSSLTSLLVAAVPLVGAVLGRLAGDYEPLGGRGVAGLLVGLTGVGALVGLDVRGTDIGALLAVAVVIAGYALGPLILSRSLSRLPSLGMVTASLSLTAVGYAPVGILALPRHLPNGRVLASVVVLASLCTAVAFLLFFRLIAEIGPVRATVITCVNPAMAVALGVAFLHERFTVGIGVGFVLVLAGSVLATRRTRPPTGQRADRAPATVAVGEP